MINLKYSVLSGMDPQCRIKGSNTRRAVLNIGGMSAVDRPRMEIEKGLLLGVTSGKCLWARLVSSAVSLSPSALDSEKVLRDGARRPGRARRSEKDGSICAEETEGVDEESEGSLTLSGVSCSDGAIGC